MRVHGSAAAAAVLAVVAASFLAATDPQGALHGIVDTSSRVALWGMLVVAGARIAARLLRSELTGLAHVVWDGGAGLALIIAIVLAIGLVPGGFRAATVRVVLVAIAGGGALARRGDRRRLTGAVGALLPGLVAIAALGLAWDRVPPVFFDTRAYHFALPELWLVTGRITPETWSLHSWFPPGMPVLYGIGLATGGERYANDANLVVGLGLIAAAFDLGRRLFDERTGLLAALLAATLPLTVYALAIPAADLGHGFFVFAALGALLLSTHEPGWIARASLLAGGAVLTKYLGFLVPAALGAAWLAMRAKRVEALRFVAPAVLLVLPWLAMNAVRIGNPVAPVGASILGAHELAPGGAASFAGDARSGVPGGDELRALPAQLVTGGEEASRLYPSPAFGWLPVILLPLAIWAARDDRTVRALAILAGVLFAVWFATFRWERFLVATGALLSVALAAAVVALARRDARLRILPAAVALAAAIAVLAPLLAVERFDAGARVAFGRETPDRFLESGLPLARLFRETNARLDPGHDRVLMLGEMRHYGLAVPRSAPTGFNVHPLVEALRADPDPARADATLRAGGFTHLLVDSGWVARSAAQYPSLAFVREHPETMQRYLDALGAPLLSEGRLALYRIPG